MRSRSIQRAIKCVGDRVVSGLGLLVLSPLLAAIAVAVRLSSPGPVFFRQQRPGLGGRPFTIYKFRTMTVARGDDGELLPDEQRLTRLGRLLRSTSLDELPELLNVLRGEMSLVGPRPLLTKYMPYYSERERKRFNVFPGITGWAQVSGRNELPWDARLACDVWYVENWSLLLDLRILWLTLWQTLRRKGVQVAPRLTMSDLDEERSRSAS